MKAGDSVPHFDRPNQDGTRVSHISLETDVVYFYPKAFTPGCTAESCDFRLPALPNHMEEAGLEQWMCSMLSWEVAMLPTVCAKIRSGRIGQVGLALQDWGCRVAYRPGRIGAQPPHGRSRCQGLRAAASDRRVLGLLHEDVQVDDVDDSPSMMKATDSRKK